ncbi:MAG: hypothetical protein N4A68_07490 [Maledivibacter sp.]|jgi:hypothetical protein|nr:hypothetical protein [Maledivibacter sp.]
MFEVAIEYVKKLEGELLDEEIRELGLMLSQVDLGFDITGSLEGSRKRDLEIEYLGIRKINYMFVKMKFDALLGAMERGE